MACGSKLESFCSRSLGSRPALAASCETVSEPNACWTWAGEIGRFGPVTYPGLDGRAQALLLELADDAGDAAVLVQHALYHLQHFGADDASEHTR